MSEIRRLGMSFLLIVGVLCVADGGGSSLRYLGAILLGGYATLAYSRTTVTVHNGETTTITHIGDDGRPRASVSFRSEAPHAE